MTFKDLKGLRFGRLLVVEYSGLQCYGRSSWKCECDCGKLKIAMSKLLLNGHTRSCGCLAIEMVKTQNITHGESSVNKSPEYKSWINAKRRCQNSKRSVFKHYGGRGIKMCERWFLFENFLADMGRKPSPKHSLERINNEGNYEPANCCWATQKEQCNNRRTNRFIDYDGQRLTIAQWSLKTGINDETIRVRLSKGLSPDKILSPI